MGFTYRGRHSSEFGLICTLTKRDMLPKSKESIDSSIAIDGEYDFSDVNEDDRIKYETRVIEYECQFLQPDMTNLQKQASKIAGWLAGGYDSLICDDMNGVIWDAKIANQLDLTYVIARVGVFTLTFKCQPFSHKIYGTFGPLLNDLVQLESDVLLDESANYTYHISGYTTLIVYNEGTWYVRPVIEVTGSCSNLIISCGDKELVYDSYIPGGETVIFDCEKYEAVTGRGINAMDTVSGDFIELSPGYNLVRFYGDNLDFDVVFGFTPRYIYGMEG